MRAPRLQARSTAVRGDLLEGTYGALRDLIVYGRMAPGARIVESEIADRLAVSRTPVRGALQKLQQEGYIHAVGGGKNNRLVVAPLTWEDALELYSIIAELEALATRWASGLEPPKVDGLVRRLRQLNAELHGTGSSERLDTHAIFDIHTEFHWRIVDAVDAPRLRALHQAIKPQAERYRRIYSTNSRENIEASVREHESIIQNIADRNGAAAEEAVRANWRNSAARLNRLMQVAGERGSW